MPGFDGTGPRGLGAMTGGGRGKCVSPAGGYVRPRLGIGRGAGRGGGRGLRNMFYATGLTGWQRSGIAPGAEKEALKSEEAYLRQELAEVQNRISALDKDNKEQ